MAEKQELPFFSPGPSKEHFEKFQVPEWKSELPDIRMQKQDPKEMDAKAKAYLEHLMRSDEIFGREGDRGNIDNFILQVKELKVAKLEEKETIRTKIADIYPSLCHVQINEINSINKYLENLKGNIQYDTRWTIQMFEKLLDRVNEPLRMKDKLDEEGIALLKMVKKDLLWSLSQAKINEACGPAYEIYFDGELQIAQLRTVNRTEILASDFINLFSKESKGEELTTNEKQLVKLSLSKTRAVDREEYIPQEHIETEGLRERAIEYQDAYNYWEFAAAATAQKNLENDFNADGDAGEHYMNVDQTTYRFMSKVLDSELTLDGETGQDMFYINNKGDKVQVKKGVLNIYDMPKSAEEYMRRYFATMHELVVNNDTVKQSLEKISKYIADNKLKFGDPLAEKVIDDLARKYINQANYRIKNWDALDEKSAYDRLADTVIHGMVNLDMGMFACGELGWHFEYKKEYLDEMKEENRKKYYGFNAKEKDKKKIQKEKTGSVEREFVITRKSSLGSIYDNHDITTVVYIARHIIDYDNLAETRGTLLHPSIGPYRERWLTEPPYWKPSFEEFAPNDKVIASIRDAWENDRWKDIQVRKQFEKGKKGMQPQYYGEIDPQVKAYIRENAWPFVTPWLSEPGKGGDEYLLSQIVLMPTWIEEINGWRNFSLEKASDNVKDTFKNDGVNTDNKSKESIWHKRIKGNNLSDLKWENLNRYAFNWFRVNTDQMSRWLGPWVTLHDYNKLTVDEFIKHNAMPESKSEKEAGKRGRLGGRGSRWAEGVLRATRLAQAKVLGSIQLGEVMKNKNDANLENGLNRWRDGWISPWINAEIDMPREVRGVKNYNGTISQVILGTYLQTRRIVKSAIIHSEGQSTDVNSSISNIEKGIYK